MMSDSQQGTGKFCSAEKAEQGPGNGFNSLKRYLSNTGWLFSGKILRMSVSMVVGIAVARYLGAENFGILSYSMAFALLFRPLAMLQLQGLCVREMVTSPGKRNEILGSAFVLSLVAGLLTFFLVVNLITFLKPSEPIYITIVSIMGLGLVFLSFEIFDYWFQANVYSKPVVFARTTVLLLVALGKTAGIVFKAPIEYFAVTNLAELILTATALGFAYHRSGARIRELRVSMAWIKQLISDAWPLALSGMAATIYLRIDKIMLGEILSVRDVGIYTAATRLAEAWYFLPICIMTSLYPAVVKLLKNRTEDSGSRMQQIYSVMVLMGYLAGILTVMSAEPLITLLFGPDYHQAAQVLTLYIWAGIFVNIAMVKAAYLKAMNYAKIQLVSTVVGAIVNVGLNLVLIQHYGIMGAAWATIVSYAIEGYLILFVFPSTRMQAVMISRAFVFPLEGLRAILKNSR